MLRAGLSGLGWNITGFELGLSGSGWNITCYELGLERLGSRQNQALTRRLAHPMCQIGPERPEPLGSAHACHK